jgi:hypothetical protein
MMKFNGATFQFGKVEIVIGAMDTERVVASIDFNFPVGDIKVGIHCNKGISWNEDRRWDFRISAVEIKPAAETEDESDREWLEEDEEESAND